MVEVKPIEKRVHLYFAGHDVWTTEAGAAEIKSHFRPKMVDHAEAIERLAWRPTIRDRIRCAVAGWKVPTP